MAIKSKRVRGKKVKRKKAKSAGKDARGTGAMGKKSGWKKAKSAAAFKKACGLMPGGVNSPVRAFGGVDAKPLFIASGQGSRITDIGGNEFIDYVCSWGAMILGHCNPKVTAAIKKQAGRGTSFGAPTLAETELAEKLSKAFGSMEKVRLVSSGTEAVMSALRLARGFTGRELIIKMAGCYHGHSDSLLVSAGSGLAGQALRVAGSGKPVDSGSRGSR